MRTIITNPEIRNEKEFPLIAKSTTKTEIAIFTSETNGTIIYSNFSCDIGTHSTNLPSCFNSEYWQLITEKITITFEP